MYDQIRAIAYSFSRRQARLTGLWERYGDAFSGCGVLIEKTSQGLRGKITYVPGAMRKYGWQVGDLKWKDFASGRVFAYRALESYKEFDRRNGKLQDSGFVTARIGFLGPDEMVVFPSGRNGVKNTHWRRSGVVGHIDTNL